MVIRHTPEQVNEYYERVGLNQSSLKIILSDGVQSFLDQRSELMRQDDLYYEEKKHFIIGSAVDCHITHGQEIYKQKYYSSTLTRKPGPKSLSVIKLAFDKAKEQFPLGVDISMAAYKKQVYEAACDEEFDVRRANKDGNWELDTRIASLMKNGGQEYWSDLVLSENKQILSTEETFLINNIVMSLTTHPHTRGFFQDSKDITIIYQLPLYFTWNDVDCKGMVDIVIVNHTTKRIYLIDLKTFGGYVLNFRQAINRRRYDIQGDFYTVGMEQNISTLAMMLDKDLTGYTIANFAFMVESTIRPGTPMVYILGEEYLKRGRNGDEQFKGWVEAVEIYKTWEQAGFSIEQMFKDTNGVIFLNQVTTASIYDRD
jgi:hypothetical protein